MGKLKQIFTDKETLKEQIGRTLLVVLGNASIAFGTAIFLTELGIVSGGLSGIGIMFQHILGDRFGQIIDIVVFVFTWILWGISYFVLGKEFAFKTLLSAIIYPLILSLLLRVDVFSQLAKSVAYYPGNEPIEGVKPAIGNLLLCSLFSGFFIGSGVGCAFLGGGSSGGVDVIVAIIAKYSTTKESVASILVDGTIIAISAILLRDIVPAMCGLVSAVVTGVMVNIVYIRNDSSLQVDIISDKWKEIRDYAFKVLDRGGTIIHAEGAYSGQDKKVLRIVFNRRQYLLLKNYIAHVDPKAFVTFTPTNAVYGEGFKTNNVLKKKKK